MNLIEISFFAGFGVFLFSHSVILAFIYSISVTILLTLWLINALAYQRIKEFVRQKEQEKKRRRN